MRGRRCRRAMCLALRPSCRARARLSGVTIAPATSSAPSTPSVSPAMAKIRGRPSSSTASDSRNSTFRPPLPAPPTVTVVSPPEMRTQGEEAGWPWTYDLARDSGHHFPDFLRLALERVAEDERAIAGFRGQIRRGHERGLRSGDDAGFAAGEGRIAGLGRLGLRCRREAPAPREARRCHSAATRLWRRRASSRRASSDRRRSPMDRRPARRK